MNITVVQETGSTNADLIARLRDGEALAEGEWLRAERQHGGRGRDGRVWESPEGNLYCSTLVRLRPGDSPAHLLSLVAALALYEMLRGQLFGATPILLKWPNDVLVDGAKIAGILLERSGEAVVVGFGVNVLVAPQVPGRATICIAEANGKNDNGPERVLTYLAEAFADGLQNWRTHDTAWLLAQWTRRAHPKGTPLKVNLGDGSELHGRFDGLTGDGALILARDDGTQHIVHSGDVGIL